MITALVFMLVFEMVSSFGCLPRSSALSQCAGRAERSMRRNFCSEISNSRPSCRTTSSSRRRELTCGLQVTVRIRGKKSREDDYTNQVGAVCLFLPLLWRRCHPSWNIQHTHTTAVVGLVSLRMRTYVRTMSSRAADTKAMRLMRHQLNSYEMYLVFGQTPWYNSPGFLF